MTKFKYILTILTLFGCSVTVERLNERNLYSYIDNGDFFPKEIQGNSRSESFYADGKTSILKRLAEKSLCNKYSGRDIIRLTAIKSFANHYSITVSKDIDKIVLTEKETLRDGKSIKSSDTTRYIEQHIEFDSVSNNYVLIKIAYLIGIDSTEELERKVVDPIVEYRNQDLEIKTWNELVKIINDNSFYDMSTAEGSFGLDGHHFLLETHTKNGYYVVDRWSPKDGNFKTIVDFIIGLTDREPEK